MEMMESEKPYRFYPSARLGVALLISMTMAVIGGGFVSFNFSIVCMVNDTALRPDQQQTTWTGLDSVGGKDDGYLGEFVWNKVTQSTLLAAHSYGAMLFNLPMGLIADRYGAKYIILAAFALNSLANVFTPIAAYGGAVWLFIARFVQGVGAGMTYPAAVLIASVWATPSETATMMTLTILGTQLGYFLAMATSSVICTSQFRWPLTFYTWAVISFIYSILWYYLYTDDIEKCRFISKAELDYLQKNKTRKRENKKLSFRRIPWKHILCSPSTIALYVGQFSESWATYYISTFMPTYSKEVLRLSVGSNGLNSSFTSLSQCLGRLVFGPLGDKVTFCGSSITVSTKVFNALCTVVPALCFVLVGFLDGGQTILAVLAFCVASLFLASNSAGYVKAGVLIAPQYAGLIGSLYNMCGYVAAIGMPYAVAGMTSHATVQEWKYTAFLTAAVLAISFFQFTLMGSAEEQKWAKQENSDPAKVHAVQDIPPTSA